MVVLLGGVILLGVSLYQTVQSTPVMRGPATIPLNSPYLAFQGSYDGASGQTTVVGSLHGPGCCVSFYVFTYDAFNNWTENHLEATNPSNSPFVNLSSSADLTSSGFSLTPLPVGGYYMVFVNNNRLLWHTNTTSTTQVDANVRIDYRNAPYGSAIYPSVTLLGLGAAIVVATALPSRYRFASRSALVTMFALAVVVILLIAALNELGMFGSSTESGSYPVVQEAKVMTPSGQSNCLVVGLQVDCGVSISRGDSGSVTVDMANGATGTINLGIQFSVNSTGGSRVQLASVPTCAYARAPNFSSQSCFVNASSTQTFSFDFVSPQTYTPSNETSILLQIFQTCCFE